MADKLRQYCYVGIAREIMSHPIFRPMGRLTYCAFLVHPAVLRIYLGNLRQPVYNSDMVLVGCQYDFLKFQFNLIFFLRNSLHIPRRYLCNPICWRWCFAFALNIR